MYKPSFTLPCQMAWFVFLFCLLKSPAHATTFYVSSSGKDNASGTIDAPWRTIQHGADALHPGDTLLIGQGIYRERIELKQSGTAQAPITLAALSGAKVVVSGANRLQGGWNKVEGAEEGIYVHKWAYLFPIASVRELTHPGDKEHKLTGRAEQVIHSGRLLRQVLTRQQLAPGTFFVEIDTNKLFVWLRGSDDPNKTEIEASTRIQWLVASSVSYVHVRGLTFRYAANHAQRGAFAINQENNAVAQDWVVEDCIFERTNGSGVSLSGQNHVFRRCTFQDNGQLGFGTSRCHNSRMEQCGIYRNNVKGYSTGWEAGGYKVTMSQGFVFDGCRAVDNRGVGLWYDIGNEQSEVKNCCIADNDEAGIFYEISYGLHAHDNLIVNNANNSESVGGAWGSGGITLSSSEDCIVDHNTLVGNRDGIDLREQDRTTPRIDAKEGAGEVRVRNRNHQIRDNLIAYSQAYNIGFWMDTTFFGVHPSGGDKTRPLSDDPKTLDIRLANNLLWSLPKQANYLYGVPWRSRSKQSHTVAEFVTASGITDTSRIADPQFANVQAGDYHLRPGSPALKMKAGQRREVSTTRR